jgi:hypothetical protein
MDNPTPPWPQHTVYLIDETEQFVTCEVLDYVKRHNHVERSIRLRRQSRQKITFLYPLNTKPSCGCHLLRRTIYPPGVGVACTTGEVNEGAMTATQVQHFDGPVSRKVLAEQIA